MSFTDQLFSDFLFCSGMVLQNYFRYSGGPAVYNIFNNIGLSDSEIQDLVSVYTQLYQVVSGVTLPSSYVANHLPSLLNRFHNLDLDIVNYINGLTNTASPGSSYNFTNPNCLLGSNLTKQTVQTRLTNDYIDDSSISQSKIIGLTTALSNFQSAVTFTGPNELIGSDKNNNTVQGRLISDPWIDDQSISISKIINLPVILQNLAITPTTNYYYNTTLDPGYTNPQPESITILEDIVSGISTLYDLVQFGQKSYQFLSGLSTSMFNSPKGYTQLIEESDAVSEAVNDSETGLQATRTVATTAAQDIGTVEKNVSDLTNSYQALEDQYSAVEQSYMEMTKITDDLDSRLVNCQAQVDGENELISAAQASASAAETTALGAVATAGACQAEIDGIEAEIGVIFAALIALGLVSVSGSGGSKTYVNNTYTQSVDLSGINGQITNLNTAVALMQTFFQTMLDHNYLKIVNNAYVITSSFGGNAGAGTGSGGSGSGSGSGSGGGGGDVTADDTLSTAMVNANYATYDNNSNTYTLTLPFTSLVQNVAFLYQVLLDVGFVTSTTSNGSTSFSEIMGLKTLITSLQSTVGNNSSNITTIQKSQSTDEGNIANLMSTSSSNTTTITNIATTLSALGYIGPQANNYAILYSGSCPNYINLAQSIGNSLVTAGIMTSSSTGSGLNNYTVASGLYNIVNQVNSLSSNTLSSITGTSNQIQCTTSNGTCNISLTSYVDLTTSGTMRLATLNVQTINGNNSKSPGNSLVIASPTFINSDLSTATLTTSGAITCGTTLNANTSELLNINKTSTNTITIWGNQINSGSVTLNNVSNNIFTSNQAGTFNNSLTINKGLSVYNNVTFQSGNGGGNFNTYQAAYFQNGITTYNVPSYFNTPCYFSGSADLAGQSYWYYATNNMMTNQGYFAGGSGTHSTNTSIVSTGRIVAAEFDATSSLKIKNVKDENFLDNLSSKFRQIKFVKYDYKDKVSSGYGDYYGVIAENISKIFPDYVKNDPAFVPNIMRNASKVIIKNDRSHIYLEKPFIQDLYGTKVKIMTDQGKITTDIITYNEMEIVVEGAIKNTTNVFVYGTYETCPSVNKIALCEISMVLLQQEIIKRELLEKKNSVLESQIGECLLDLSIFRKSFILLCVLNILLGLFIVLVGNFVF